MKPLVVASLALFALLAAACRDAAPPAAPSVAAGLTGRPTISHFVSNGAQASVSWYSSDDAGVITFGSVGVSRGDAVNNPQTFLFYDVFQCTPPDYSCAEVEGGNGTIPNGDFTGGGKTLRLSTNTADNPNVAGLWGTVGASR